MEQWDAYFEADAHDKTGKSNAKVSYYVSTEYRKSISDSNKAAKRFMKLSDEQLGNALENREELFSMFSQKGTWNY